MLDINEIKIKVENLTDSYGKFIIEPLDRGYGATLGNSLRRVLLSSLPGASATAIRIEGIMHEFSTLPGVKEDVNEIILNVKEIVFKMYGSKSEILRLKVSGKKIVTAGDIIPNINVEILNPEQTIATLSSDGKLDMEIIIEQGTGYITAPENKKKGQAINYINIDSLFSPVIKVAYNVDKASSAQFMNCEKLVLDIYTNKSILPDEALSKSANILIKYLKVFNKFSPDDIDIEVEQVTEEENEGNEQKKLLEKTIEELDLSVRSYNCLKKSNINTFSDIINRTEEEIMSIKNLGKKSFEEIKEKVTEFGYNLKGSD
ncbi:MAG: DNA-directed RNA polymerase subunit alpha [Atribacterota bacterium]|nr:DNA-directed RNA polymerase subunit alpha [Atribacterota bacterium]MDD5636404.1 DNA-directed RNA polymerase subunit alpha [Atribacterota bacterium]